MPTTSHEIRGRVGVYDWSRVTSELDAWGCARLPALLTGAECRSLLSLWDRPERFRSRIDMARHRFGVGEYRYFADPLPNVIRALRTHLYARLARIANGWQVRLTRPEMFPARWSELRKRCEAEGQERPTPLMLRYEAGGYNCLHQDLYGSLAFPLQVVCLLSKPGNFSGGEVLLVEQRPRMQSRAEAIQLARGEALVFPNRERPVDGTRGPYRVSVRHGVSRVRGGQRTALGIIFHQAR